MPGSVPHLLLVASVGAALLALGALAAVGGKRTVRLVRDLGLGGLLLALFVGVVAESLSLALTESRPYTLGFLSTGDLRVQALMDDPDLRHRANADPRLRYIPTGGERVPNLESAYVLDDGLRALEFPILTHAAPVPLPRGVEPLSPYGDPQALRREVDGLYASSAATVADAGRLPDEGRADLLRTGSVGLLVLGLFGLVAGLPPFLGKLLVGLNDVRRLVAATGHRSYRGTRSRAVRTGSRALFAHTLAEGRPFASLATFGLLAVLAGALLGFLREEETRRLAHAVFAEARHLRIEGKGKG